MSVASKAVNCTWAVKDKGAPTSYGKPQEPQHALPHGIILTSNGPDRCTFSKCTHNAGRFHLSCHITLRWTLVKLVWIIEALTVVLLIDGRLKVKPLCGLGTALKLYRTHARAAHTDSFLLALHLRAPLWKAGHSLLYCSVYSIGLSATINRFIRTSRLSIQGWRWMDVNWQSGRSAGLASWVLQTALWHRSSLFWRMTASCTQLTRFTVHRERTYAKYVRMKDI